MGQASCAEVQPDLFFSETGNHIETRLAKSVCAQCPVIEQCLEYALAYRMEFGVWGGLSSQERKSLLRKHKIPRKK